MPLIYGLPTAALLLASQGAVEQAVEVYACVSRHGFVANSHWFEEMVGQRIRALAASPPLEAAESAQERGQVRDLEEVAAGLLAEW